MTNKNFIPRLLTEVKLRWPLPTAPRQGFDLLEQGAVAVLMRHYTQRQAEAGVAALQTAYEDWNEVRVSQVQEIGSHLERAAGKKAAGTAERGSEGARTLKDYLQEVFQKTHGLDLEFMREDMAAGAKVIAQMPVLGQTGGSYLLWIAGGEQVPVHLSMMRFLDRLGLIGRTTSVAKATAAIAPLVPEGKSLAFTAAVHEALDRWTDPDRPIYEDVAVLRECPYGKKAFVERQASLARQDAQRKRDEERTRQQQKKELELQRKEEERARKKAESLAKRHARETEKRRKAEQRRAKADAKRQAAEKEAKRKAAEKVKAAAAKKKAAEKAKAAAAKKKVAAKKAGSKKATGKKKATKKPVARKGAAKKTTRKKVTAKKATTRKKAASKKTTTRKPAANKKATKAVRKKAASAPAGKKAASKKTSAKKSSRAKPAKKKTKGRRSR